MAAVTDLSNHEWKGYCGCSVERAVEMFKEKYGECEVETIESCIVLVRVAEAKKKKEK